VSLFDIDVPLPGLPIDRIELIVDDAAFARPVEVLGAAADGEEFVVVATSFVHRTPGLGTSLMVSLPPERRPRLRLRVRDRGEAPLRLQAVRLLWRLEELSFLARRGGPHTALIGDPRLFAPAYDLREALERQGTTSTPAAKWDGPPEPNQSAPRAAGGGERPGPLDPRLIVGAGLCLLLAGAGLSLYRRFTRRG
jgi:hypothetical protein